MPNQPSPDKIHLGVRIPRSLHRKLKKLATCHGVSITDLVYRVLLRETENILLTIKDYEEISVETCIAEMRLRDIESGNSSRGAKKN